MPTVAVMVGTVRTWVLTVEKMVVVTVGATFYIEVQHSICGSKEMGDVVLLYQSPSGRLWRTQSPGWEPPGS